MNSPLQCYLPFPKTLAATAGRPCLVELPARSCELGHSWTSMPLRPVHTMRDRSKNRRPLQKGRNLSIEAIQTMHSLKLSKNDEVLRGRVFETKVRRLIKADMVAVLRELLRQDECLLALQVFDDVREEYWYKPQVLLYTEIIAALLRSGMIEGAEVLFSMMKTEICEADDEGLNSLAKTLMVFNMPRTAMECFQLMKKVGSEPDKSTFRALVNHMNAKGEFDVSLRLRREAEKQFGVPWEFLVAEEET
ncbi:Pentatricopeptide repeat-containing protein [Nymphaea thermarum]|nr:Pentatricopeptide repeat-containing protein [Nymphaea thermarum]